jgi:hypothetical protein
MDWLLFGQQSLSICLKSTALGQFWQPGTQWGGRDWDWAFRIPIK